MSAFAGRDDTIKCTYEQVRSIGYFFRDLRCWIGCNLQQRIGQFQRDYAVSQRSESKGFELAGIAIHRRVIRARNLSAQEA